MGGNLADGDVVVPHEPPGAELYGRDGEALAGADGVGSHLSFRWRPWSPLKLCAGSRFPVVGLVYDVGLRVEDLLIRAGVVAAAGPPAWGLPDTCCSHPSVAQNASRRPRLCPDSSTPTWFEGPPLPPR